MCPGHFQNLQKVLSRCNYSTLNTVQVQYDFCGRGPGFESGIYLNTPDALQDHCEIMKKISGKRGKPTPEAKKKIKKSTSTILYNVHLAASGQYLA